MVEVEKIAANRYCVRAHNHDITLSAADLRELMDWCQANVRELEDEAQVYTLRWHPSARYGDRLAYGKNHTILWGNERLEVRHEGRWIAGRVGQHPDHVVYPLSLLGHPEYIKLQAGSSRVRNVSKPGGDGGGPEQ